LIYYLERNVHIINQGRAIILKNIALHDFLILLIYFT
jgi:hypothetical protein